MRELDSALVAQLEAAGDQILDFPRTDTATQLQLLDMTSDAAGLDMIGLSYNPTATRYNTKSFGLMD